MAKNDNQDNSSVALYWDFENLHAALSEAIHGDGSYGKSDGRFKAQEPFIDVQAVIELASSFGPIAINRAYCNWQYLGRYRDALLQGAVELIQLFSPGPNAKNGADIKLCLDAVEDINRFAHIGTVVIVGGDSDFMPVSQKIKAAGRRLIGLGTRKNTNRHWANSCHEFRYYENLIELPVGVVLEASPQTQASLSLPADAGTPAADTGAEIFRRAITLLAEAHGESWVRESSLLHMIKRLDSTFNTRDYGHDSFPAMAKALGGLIEIHMGDSDPLIRLR
ncbi:MAG: NYN domain-containing protein [Rhodoferax sp.]|nr:NYN domain-containing protein [Rhodoferax sp.]